MNVIPTTADRAACSRLILFFGETWHTPEIHPRQYSNQCMMASSLQDSSLLQCVFVVEPVSEDLYDLVKYTGGRTHHIESYSCILILDLHLF